MNIKMLGIYLFIFSVLTIPSQALIADTLEPVIVYGEYDEDTPFSVTGNPPNWSVQSVDLIDADEIKQTGSDRLEDFADYFPGVLLGRNQAGIASNVYLRGFSLQGRLHLDGLPDNRRYYLRDPATIERVEMIKGLDSVLFGSGSPGGIVNYVSKKPNFNHIRQLTLGTGSPERYRFAVDVGDEVKHTDMAWRAIIAGQKAETGRKHVGDDRFTFMPSFLLQNDAHELFLQAEFSRQNRDYDFDNVFIDNQPVYDVSYTDPRTDSIRENSRFSLQYLRSFDSKWIAHLNASFIDGKRDEKLVGFWQMNPDQRTLEGFYRKIRDDYKQYAFRGELQKGFSAGKALHKTRFGVDLFRQESDVKSAHEIGGFTLDAFNPVFDYSLPDDVTLTRRDARTVDEENALYLHHRIKLADTLLFTAGLRSSRFSADSFPADSDAISISNNTVNSSLGAVWQFSPQWKFFANHSESFSPNSGRDKNSHPFEPKRGLQHEVGLRYQKGKESLTFEGSVYQIDQENLLTRDPTDTAYKIPLGEVRIRGVELKSTIPIGGKKGAKIGAKTVIKPTYSFYDSEITQNNDGNEGNQLHSVPRHSASIKLDYQANPGLNLNIGAVYVGRRMGDNANSFMLPSYTRVDAGAQWHMNKRTSMNLGIRNLADENYVTTGGAVDFLVTGRDRTLTLETEIRF